MPFPSSAATGFKVNVEGLKRYREEFFGILKGESIDEQRAFLGQFIQRVVVGEEKVKVVYTGAVV